MTEALQLEIRTLRALLDSERDPQGRAFAPLADAYRRAGKVPDALKILRDGIAKHPDFSTGHVVAAQLYVDQGLSHEGALAARRALELDADNVLALRSLLRALDETGEAQEAEGIRSRLTSLEPDFAPDWTVAPPRAKDDAPSEAPTLALASAEPEPSPTVEPEPDAIPMIEATGVIDLTTIGPIPSADLHLSALSTEPDQPATPPKGVGLGSGSMLDLDLMDFTIGGDEPSAEPDTPESKAGEPVLDLPLLEPEPAAGEPVLDLPLLAPDPAAEELVMDLPLLAPEPAAGEPVMDLPLLAPEPTVEEPVMELADLAPTDEAVMELASLAPDPTDDGPVMELAALAPDADETVMDVGSLAPEAIDEPVMELADLAPDSEADETVVELASLAPDPVDEGPVMELADLAPDADEAVMDVGSLAPEAVEEPVMELADLAPDGEDETVMDMASLAPSAERDATDETVMDVASLAPAAKRNAMDDETVVDLASLAPEPEADEPIYDLAMLEPSELPGDRAVASAAPPPDGLIPDDEPVFDLDALAPPAGSPDPVAASPAGNGQMSAEEAVEIGFLSPDEPDAIVIDLDELGPDTETTTASTSAPSPLTVSAVVPAASDAPPAAPPVEPADSEALADDHGEPIYTRTLAELYVAQGATREALRVLRHLQSESPKDADLARRIAEVEAGTARQPAAEEAEEEVDTLARDLAESGRGGPEVDSPFNWSPPDEDAASGGGPTIREYFEELLDWEPREDK